MLSGLNMRNEPINASIEPAAKVEICVREVFNIDSDLVVIGFKDPDAYVPDIMRVITLIRRRHWLFWLDLNTTGE